MTPRTKEAILFSTVVSINNYAHLISAIVNHCKADSYHFDEELRNLLRSI